MHYSTKKPRHRFHSPIYQSPSFLSFRLHRASGGGAEQSEAEGVSLFPIHTAYPLLMASKKIKPPKGTRDLYPEDLLRQRYITNAWRDASIRCGFEEIAGPTFESTDLYAVKSGDGILNELFQTFSGKGGSETLNKLVEKGKADFALRPEFTPTLARMYAAKSKELPKPCKWFTAGPYFRAERPQRGRLREFLQWNVDVIGLPSEADYKSDDHQDSLMKMDIECLDCCSQLIDMLGFKAQDILLHTGNRRIWDQITIEWGLTDDQATQLILMLDYRPKVDEARWRQAFLQTGLTEQHLNLLDMYLEVARKQSALEVLNDDRPGGTVVNAFAKQVINAKLDHRYLFDPFVVRGLAYYTGTVFEALADGERAVAGGGRYDNLIELFGGPPTPACGFGMGDVVLGNLLGDKALMPTGVELMEAVARPQASIRPEAFVVSNGDESTEALVHTLTANLRRGIESESWLADDSRKPWNKDRYTVAPMHARISYKSTTKLNKLRDDAIKQHAKFFIVIDDENNAQLHNLDTRESLGSFSPNPTNDNYIGRAIATYL